MARKPLHPGVIAERDAYLALGMRQVTVAQYDRDIRAFGFKLDRMMDCRSMARCLSTGRTYPCITSSAKQISTGAGFANVACDRGEGWLQFMAYRREHFAVHRGAIFTV